MAATVSTSFELTAIFEPVEEGWVQARIEEIPGVITAGASLEEARALLPDALQEYLLALGELDMEPRDRTGSVQRTRLAVTFEV